jgi:hypothetical protein
MNECYSGIVYSGIITVLAVLELFRYWLFWNYSGIGYSGIIPELSILELFRNRLFWNYSGIAILEYVKTKHRRLVIVLIQE